jgi:hypothetical protein
MKYELKIFAKLCENLCESLRLDQQSNHLKPETKENLKQINIWN